MQFNFLKIIKTIKQEYLALAIFAFLIAAFYGNTLFNGFVNDDIGQIVANENVHSLRYLPKAFTDCFWESVFGSCEDTIQYRPIMSVSFILTYAVSSSAWFFHLVNLLYFLAAVFLSFILIKILTKNFLLALLTAAIFVVHPINTEVVNWVSAVPELTYAIFILLAVIFYLKYQNQRIKTMRKRKVSPENDMVESGLLKRNGDLTDKNLLLVFLFYFLGMFSKEPAILLPAIFLFLDVTFFKISIKRLFSIKECKRYFVFAGLVGFYLSLSAIVLKGLAKSQSFYTFTVYERIYAFFDLFVQFLKKLFLPYPLKLFYYPFEKKSDFFGIEFFLIFIAVSLFFISIYFLIKNGLKIHALFLFWIFVFLSPALIFVTSLGENIFSERYLFASVIGFSFIVSSVLIYLLKRENIFLKTAGIVLLIFIIVSSWFVVDPRNKIWKDNETLAGVTLAQNPDAHSVRFDRAVAWGMEKGDFEGAKNEFEEILRRAGPNYVYIDKVYSNLGDIYQQRGDIDTALEFYQKAIDAQTKFFTPYNSAGVIYAQKEQYIKAATYFCRVLLMNPEGQELQANFNRAVSMAEKRYEKDKNLLYADIAKSGLFFKNTRENIQYRQRLCADEKCSFLFSFQIESGEILLPFAIVGVNSSGKAVEVVNSSFNPQTSEIMLETDPKYKDEQIKFIFPTCEGKYYEAAAP